MKISRLRKLLAIIGCMVLIAAMALVTTGCDSKTEAPAEAAPVAEVKVLGEGATTFDFTVEDIDGTKYAYTIHTDETTVGAALMAVGLLKGEDGPYGLYVQEVNGIRAVYEEDGTYWAFYVNGEYGMSGCELTEIEDGATYAFRAEK